MIFVWDEEKNRFLAANRGISFERILVAIEEGDILDVLEHPNKMKYAKQKLYVLNIDGYAWIVPFRDETDQRLLITAFPSRKYTSLYLKKENRE